MTLWGININHHQQRKGTTMKTTTEEFILQLIGSEKETRITADRFGETTEHANGYLVGDPCYWMPKERYKAFSAAASRQAPEAYHGIYRGWVQIDFDGQPAYFITCSDGVHFGHNVDSGWVAVVKGTFNTALSGVVA